MQTKEDSSQPDAPTPWLIARWKAAWLLADALTWLVSMFRPIQQHMEEVFEEDRQGGETSRLVSEPCVFVQPVKGAPCWLNPWLESDGREHSLCLYALGCHIEIFYLRGVGTVQTKRAS